MGEKGQGKKSRVVFLNNGFDKSYEKCLEKMTIIKVLLGTVAKECVFRVLGLKVKPQKYLLSAFIFSFSTLSVPARYFFWTLSSRIHR